MLIGQVSGGVRNMPVGRYIRRAWPMLPAHALRDAFKRRDVKINASRADEGDPVCEGDQIQIFIPDKYNPAPIQTTFDDGRLLACVKPQGLPVDKDADGIGEDTLLSRIRKHCPTAQLCHRLDAQTGGIVLAAADADTLQRATDTFKLHAVQKTYLSIAKGGFSKREGVLRGYLIKDAKAARVQIAVRAAKDAKPIETRYRVLDDAHGMAYVQLEPITGRTHQLRAHLASIGHPILGDDKYGDRAFNRASGGLLRLWCDSIRIQENSPLEAYRGQTFSAPRPDWWKD